MISVMNIDFDLGKNKAPAEEPRVSNDGSEDVDSTMDERVGNMNVNEEIRVPSGRDLGVRRSECDESRVLPGAGQEGNSGRVFDGTYCRANGDSDNLVGVEASSGNEGVDGDGEIDFRSWGEESRNAQNEEMTLETGVVSCSVDRTGESTTSSFDALSDGKMRQKVIRNNGLKTDVMIGDYRLERRSVSRALVSSDVGASGINAVVRAGSMKVLGSGFEMGDMVWGKVKSHPWWPGHLFDEAFVSSSVRRTRRDGHILVAFFGDSSYGWFDPSELVPYDPHYAEKSQQTNSRSFLKAVEESVDEASRRSALGLSCYCRNRSNFRPTNMTGYLAVDVVDYEPGAIYSVSQIQRARESFQPADTLSFIKQLAAAPSSGESKSLSFIKQKATTLAYRRSIFEEFDETYAQAFGQEPVRPSQLPQPPTDKETSRAPLSGPLVIAEALGGRRSSTKVTKPKDLLKKDRYLFMRRDETGELRTNQVSQVHSSSSLSSAYEDGTSDLEAANYVFRKRDHAISTNDDLGGTPARNQVATYAHQTTTKDAHAELGFMSSQDEAGKKFSLEVTIDSKQSESGAAVTAVVSDVHGVIPDNHISSITSADADMVKKKKKVAKRPAGEQGSKNSDVLEKKKKKKLRKTDGERTEHPETLSSGSGEKYLVKPAGRPMQITAAVREDLQVSNRQKDIEVNNCVPRQVGSVSSEAYGEDEVQLPQMLADLQGLALNPFHGAERNRPAIARQFFLKFRSLVFLKASSALSTVESEPSEARSIRLPSATESTDKPPTEGSKSLPSLKPSKLPARHGNAARGTQKRLPSERQEEIAAKRAKKIAEVKSLTAEKMAVSKNPEMLRADGKVKVAVAQQSSPKPMKSEQQVKKVDRPPRVEEPTYLVMKFQSGSSLPSLVELKARFARFGPMDTSLSRVFYKTNTCRVAFLFKQDANVAYRYAVGSKSVFSNVKFLLKPVAAPEPQQPSIVRAEDLHSDPSSNWDSSAVEPRPAVSATSLMQQQPVQQLKSCLKKPSGGDEPMAASNGGSTVRAPRVRFNMGEDKGGANNRGVVQVQMESRTAIPSSSEGGPSCSPSSSVSMDVINNQRFIPSLPLQPPPAPHLPHFPRAPINHPQHQVEVTPRSNFNYNLGAAIVLPGVAPLPPSSIQAPAPPPPTVDISHQMMNLLTRCHDVVNSVKNILGYVPYHPL